MDHLKVLYNHLFGAASSTSGAAARYPPSLPCTMPPVPSNFPAGLGLFPSVGNKVHDLLCSGFNLDKKIAVTTYTDQLSVTSSFSKESEDMILQILASVKLPNVNIDLNSTSESALAVTMKTKDLPAVGIYTVCTMHYHDLNAGKAEIQYLHDYAGISAGIMLKRNPVMTFSGLFGTKTVSVGADLEYDTATGRFRKYDVAMGLGIDGLFSSLVLSNKCDDLTAGYYHLANKEAKLIVGAEMTHNFSSKKTTALMGFQQYLDSETVLKFKHSTDGISSLLIQYELMPKSFLTVSGAINTFSMECPKIGLALVLKP